LSPVSRLNSVLFPELGLPTTAMLASERLATVISLAGMRVSAGLVTSRYGCHLEETGVLLAQRNAVAKEAEFYRVTPDCRARVLDLGALDEPQHHEALNLRIGRVDCLDDTFFAPSQGSECAAVDCHFASNPLISRHFHDDGLNDNDSHY
jgi:hypothetical protein